MARELSESQAKQERLARRRRAAAVGGYTKDDPEDSITFVVYPIDPEAPVRLSPCLRACLCRLSVLTRERDAVYM